MRKMRLGLVASIVAVALFGGGVALTQITFEHRYGGNQGFSVIQTSDQGYAIAGETRSPDKAVCDVYLVKTDSLGDTLWTRSYGGGENDYGRSVVQAPDGGYVVTGWSESWGAAAYNPFLIKIDSLGNLFWIKTYGGNRVSAGLSVAKTSDGGYILTGSIQPTPGSFDNVYLVKTNSLGDTLWTRNYGDTKTDIGRSVAQTTNGGYIIAGQTYSFGAGMSNVYLIKTDSLGFTLWTKTYGGNYDDVGMEVAQTSNGGFIIGGYTFSYGAGYADFYFIKTDSLGDTIWTKTYGGSDDDEGRSVAKCSDGGYGIVGWTESYSSHYRDIYLIKTDSLGDTLWTRTYGLWDGGQGESIAQTSDEGFIIAGETGSGGIYLIKTNSLGEVIGIEGQTYDYLPKDFLLFQNYPNSFNPTTEIKYALPRDCQVRLEVYNILGEKIATLVDENQAPGYKAVTWNAKDVGSGIYFYRLQAGSFVETRKMVLIR